MVGRIAVRLVLSLGLVLAVAVTVAISATATTGTSEMSVSMSGPGRVGPGGLVTYTIDVTNLGPDEATNVIVDDVLPAGETFVAITPRITGCFGDTTGLVECIYSTFPSGITTTISFTAQAGASLPVGTIIRNTVVVQADQTDPVPSDNSSSVTTTVATPTADIQVTNTGPATAAPGASVTYVITVGNAGPDPATNVTMKDIVPTVEVIDSVTVLGSTVVCSQLPEEADCSLGTLAVGAVVQIELVATLGTAINDGFVAENFAQASADQADPNTANSSALSDTTVLFPRTDLHVTMLGLFNTFPGPKPGDVITYRISITNLGPADATNVTMTDTVPAGETFTSIAIEPTSLFAACNPGGTISCNIPVLPAGQGIAMALTVQINNTVTDGMTITNKATGTVGANQVDRNPYDNSASWDLTVAFPRADLRVFMIGPVTAKPGGVITYSINVTNNGPADATNVTMTDTLPAGETLTSSALQPTSLLVACNLVGTISCNIPVLPAGQGIGMVLTVQLSNSLADDSTITNTATVAAGPMQVDPILLNNSSSAPVTVVVPNTDISVTNTGPATAKPGDVITYKVTVTNNGPGNAIQVPVLDTLPPGETSKTFAIEPTSVSAGCGTLGCTIYLLPSGQSISIDVTVTLANSGLADGTTLTNTATASAGPYQTDPDTTNNSSSTSLTVVFPRTDISVVQTGPATAKPGDTIAYKITVANNGPADANNVLITDTLPPGETLQTFGFERSLLYDSCVSPVISCTITVLPSGQSIILDVTAQLSTTLTPGTTITNTAIVATGANQLDPNPANNTASSTLVVQNPDTDLAITAGVSPAPVQATSAAGAPVSFATPTPSDEDGPMAVTCDATSGSIFPVGSTTVHCSATDGDDTPSTVTTSLTVTVIDTDLAITPGVSPAPVQATSAAGAAVTFTVPTASDEDGPVVVGCSSASGAIFPVGTTTVTCSATDADDSPPIAQTAFNVTVVDKDLAITAGVSPAPVQATSAAGAAVTFATPTASDEDGPVAVSCDATSGATFPVGPTTIHCSATDADDANSPVGTTLTVTVVDKDLAITAGVSPAPVQATSAAGAAVTFTLPTASDEDGPVVVGCSAASGSIFPVGTTTVTCSATDAEDSPPIAQTTLVVTVVDHDLALTGVPAPITVNATSPAGATVTYAAPTATDEETPPAVTCDHPSGSTFPIGTTTVTCSATGADDTPSSASATFTVTVAGAAAQLQNLLNFVQPLPPGTSLADKVNSAIGYFAANDAADTCATLNAIIHEANAQSGKHLTAAQAAQIVAMAKQIEAVIPCP